MNLISKNRAMILDEIDKMPTIKDVDGKEFIEKTCTKIKIKALMPINITERIEELEQLDYELYCHTGKSHLNEQQWEWLKEVLIVDAVPVVHGHWIDIDTETYTWKIRCSRCSHERSMMSTGKTYPMWCENCGARMDEKDGDNGRS